MAKKTGRGKGSTAAYCEELDADDLEEDGFIEGDIKSDNAIAFFNFGVVADPGDNKTITLQQPAMAKPINEALLTPQVNRGAIKGLTPPIDGEEFSLKRGYQFRPSTIRKLTELKSKHPDINVYLNTILDAAILHYYNYIFNENGEF